MPTTYTNTYTYPYLYIANRDCYYTLRQKTNSRADEHLFNLSQDAYEAHDKATQYSGENCIPLNHSTVLEIIEEKERILRLSAAERKSREEAYTLEIESKLADKKAKDAEMWDTDIINFGKHSGKHILSIDRKELTQYANGSFDPDNRASTLKEIIIAKYSHLLIPTTIDKYFGKRGHTQYVKLYCTKVFKPRAIGKKYSNKFITECGCPITSFSEEGIVSENMIFYAYVTPTKHDNSFNRLCDTTADIRF